MWKPQLGKELDLAALACAVARCRPFADTIDRQDCRALKRRRIKSRRGMRLVMLCKQDRSFKAGPAAQLLACPKLFGEPDGHRLYKRAKSARGKIYICLEQPFKSEQRLVVKCDMIDRI